MITMANQLQTSKMQPINAPLQGACNQDASALQAYSSETKNVVEFSPESISAAIRQNNLGDVPGLSEYVDWYMNREGDDKKGDYTNLEVIE